MGYTISNGQFKLVNYKDLFTLTNIDSPSLTFTIQRLENCYNYTNVSGFENLPTLEDEDSFEFKKLQDGEYQVVISQDGTDTTITLKTYLNLLESMIEDIDLILCGCDCDSCDDCATTCNDKLTTILKILSFINLTFPTYNSALESIAECIKCTLGMDISCLLINEKITGESDNALILKKIIAIYYLAFYFLELTSATDEEEEEYITNKFKFNIISKCISQLGINISEIEEKIENNMGNFTINSAAYVNRPPDVVGDNTISVANRATTVLTLAMFTTNTTPAYNDPEGDPVDAVRIDTLPPDGNLLLNNSTVTQGQIIDVADINNNLLTFVSPNQDNIDSDTFQFSLRDSGSGLFSS
jgi:hypothetical protein